MGVVPRESGVLSNLPLASTARRRNEPEHPPDAVYEVELQKLANVQAT